uniref:Synaptic vesicle 2-related protein n=1 Tax=Lygus hesperus TaxID=30085 RepID=A0A0A9ZAP7_LYGHE
MEVELWITLMILGKYSFTVRQAVNTFGFGKFQAKLSLFTGLCWMADSMEMTILSILTPALHCVWNIPRYQQALLTMVVFVGMMVSSSFWGYVGEQHGRRKALMVCAFLLICCGLASSLSTSFIWMFCLRGLVGFTVGCVPQSVNLYAEYLPSKQRAKCVVLLDCFWALGACFEVVLALLLMPTHGWNWLLVFSTTPIVAFACICPWLPESAKFYLTKGKTGEAYAILKTVASENNKSMLLGRLVLEDGSNDESGNIRDLLLPHLRNISLRLWLIWATCSFCYYGLVLLSTELLTISRNNDISRNDSSTSMTEECVLLDTRDYMDLLWTTFAEFPGILMTMFVIEKCGHKNTMAIQFGLFSLCCILLTLFWTQRLVLIPLLLIARGVIAGVFQAAYLYTPEVYTSGLRSVGLSTCSVFARLGAVFTPLISQVLLHSSLTAGITVYTVMAVVAAATSVLLPCESHSEEPKKNKSTL